MEFLQGFHTSCHIVFQNVPIYPPIYTEWECWFHCSFANNEYQHFLVIIWIIGEKKCISFFFLFNSLIINEVQKFCFCRLFAFFLIIVHNFWSSQELKEWEWGSQNAESIVQRSCHWEGPWPVALMAKFTEWIHRVLHCSFGLSAKIRKGQTTGTQMFLKPDGEIWNS